MTDEEKRARARRYKAERKARDPEGWRLMRLAQKRRYRDKYRKPGRLPRGSIAAMSESQRAAHAKKLGHKAKLRGYGLSLDEYDAMLAAQGGVCAVCGGKERNRRLAVDHCHTTGAVRGLLCSHCNTGLGHFRDDPKRLAAAVAYLERRPAGGPP